MQKTNCIVLFSFIMLFLACACNNKPHTDKNLQGKKEYEIIQLHGKPDTELKFILSDATLYEYRYSLANIFPQYKTDSIEIKEMIWKKGNKKTAIWLFQKDEQWIVVDNLTWGKEIQF